MEPRGPPEPPGPTGKSGSGAEGGPGGGSTPDPEAEFPAALRAAAEWVLRYREQVRELPVLAPVRPGQVAALLPHDPPEHGEPLSAILADVDRILLPGITHWNHPGFLAYFSSSASGPAILGELIAAALGVNAMLWRTSPAATELEERIVDWLRRAVGLPDAYGGVLQDTASTSSFVAMLAARESLGLRIREEGMAGRPDLPPLTLYLSEQAHSSIEKGAIAAGIGTAGIRRIGTDAGFRMDSAALEERLRADLAAGRRAVMVVATLGTTSTASVDPVGAIAEICGRYDVWLHVDAAYAGSAALLPEQRERFRGWEAADSIVLNPHKWMGVPLDCSVLLYRRPDAIRAALARQADYLAGEEGGTNLMDYGLALGRRFRALKLWFVFRAFGLEGLRRTLRRHLRLAGRFAAELERREEWRIAAPVSFSTVCFRALAPAHRPGGEPEAAPATHAGIGRGREDAGAGRRNAGGGREEEDRLNRRILERVNRAGRVFLSHTVLDGRYTLRLSVGNFATTEEDLEEALRSLEEAYEAESRAIR